MVSTQSFKRVYTGEVDCANLSSLPEYELKSFYHPSDVAVALAASQSHGFSSLNMPVFLEERLAQSDSHDVWNKWSFTPSAFVTGKSKGGNRVAAVVHVPSYASDPRNIATARAAGSLVNGALPISDAEVHRLLQLEGNGVMVVDHAKLLKSSVGRMSVDQTLNHVLTVPFCGSERLTILYVPRHSARYGGVGVYFRKEDLESNTSLARLLLAGNYDYYYLSAGNGLSDDGRFFGVRQNSAAGADAEKK